VSLVEDLVRRPAIRHRNGVGFLTLRSWRASCRDPDLAAFKAEKRVKTPAVIAAAAEEIAAEAKLLLAPNDGWCVTCVACGHSRDARCWGKCLARAVAASLGLPFFEAFTDRLVPGSSHPKEFKRLPPLQWASPPETGAVLLIDDLATSGWHMEEALTLLRGRGLTAVGIGWIGGTIADTDPIATAPAWCRDLPGFANASAAA
jgi:hypothetical protein